MYKTNCKKSKTLLKFKEDLLNGIVNPIPVVDMDEEEKQQECTMYATPTTAAAALSLSVDVTQQPKTKDDAKSFLMTRIDCIYNRKWSEISSHFNRMETPKSVKETKEWLSKGNYHFDLPKGWTEDEEFEEYYRSPEYYRAPFDYFGWGKKAPDRKARDETHDKLKKAKQDVIDIITIKTDEDVRLKALKDFEALDLILATKH